MRNGRHFPGLPHLKWPLKIASDVISVPICPYPIPVPFLFHPYFIRIWFFLFVSSAAQLDDIVCFSVFTLISLWPRLYLIPLIGLWPAPQRPDPPLVAFGVSHVTPLHLLWHDDRDSEIPSGQLIILQIVIIKESFLLFGQLEAAFLQPLALRPYARVRQM